MMSGQLELDLPVDSPMIGKIKNERALMAYNFFSLSRERVTELPIYDDGVVRIEVTGTKHGVANIWDKELLIYLISLLQDKLNRGESPTQTLTFTVHDFLRITGTKVAGTAYDRVEESLTRLKSTLIRTNIEWGGEGEDVGISWIGDYRIQYRRGRNGEKVMRSITIEFAGWLYRAIVKGKRILTYDPRYFQLPPIEKRLYEIARAHCGHQKAFKIGLEKLWRRVGTDNDLRRFKAQLITISKRKFPLPEYGFSVIDPRRYNLDPRMPPPPGRTPLKQLMVFFWRTDRLASMPIFSIAPEVSDDFPQTDL
jgi:plasmid replication initiation protein